MSLTSPLPSSDNNYVAPAGMRLNTAVWNALVTSIAARLNAIEAQRTDLQAVIDAGTTQALAMINENVTPLIVALQGQIATLTNEASLLQGHFDTLLAGGVPAASVTLAAISGLASTDVQSVIAELHTAVLASATRNDIVALSIALG